MFPDVDQDFAWYNKNSIFLEVSFPVSMYIFINIQLIYLGEIFYHSSVEIDKIKPIPLCFHTALHGFYKSTRIFRCENPSLCLFFKRRMAVHSERMCFPNASFLFVEENVSMYKHKCRCIAYYKYPAKRRTADAGRE